MSNLPTITGTVENGRSRSIPVNKLQLLGFRRLVDELPVGVGKWDAGQGEGFASNQRVTLISTWPDLQPFAIHLGSLVVHHRGPVGRPGGIGGSHGTFAP